MSSEKRLLENLYSAKKAREQPVSDPDHAPPSSVEAILSRISKIDDDNSKILKKLADAFPDQARKDPRDSEGYRAPHTDFYKAIIEMSDPDDLAQLEIALGEANIQKDDPILTFFAFGLKSIKEFRSGASAIQKAEEQKLELIKSESQIIVSEIIKKGVNELSKELEKNIAQAEKLGKTKAMNKSISLAIAMTSIFMSCAFLAGVSSSELLNVSLSDLFSGGVAAVMIAGVGVASVGVWTLRLFFK